MAGAVVLVHRVAGPRTVCGLPALEAELPGPAWDSFPRVQCRGCILPAAPVPVDKRVVSAEDLAEVIRALSPVASRLGVSAKLLERLVVAWEAR